MGPRPDGRGKSRLFRIPPKPPCALQWGRSRMAAERDAEIERTGVRFQVASMGPRPDGRGKNSGCHLLVSVNPGFNGAAAGWPRKEGIHQPADCATSDKR